MTAMSAGGDDQRAGQPTEPSASPVSSPADSRGGTSRRRGGLGVSGPIWVLEHVQDAVTAAVGVVLLVLACVLLIAGITDSLDGHWGPISAAGPLLLDRALLVLILVEIVYTVVLSLREHRLVAQPFIVVGLIAVIRRILFVLTPGSNVTVSTSELALLIAMVAVFVAGLIAVSRFEKTDLIPQSRVAIWRVRWPACHAVPPYPCPLVYSSERTVVPVSGPDSGPPRQGRSGGFAGSRKPCSFSHPYSGVAAGSWPHAWSPPRFSAPPSSCCWTGVSRPNQSLARIGAMSSRIAVHR
jgi:uncharacterized membrane protein (DUF373 family)